MLHETQYKKLSQAATQPLKYMNPLSAGFLIMDCWKRGVMQKQVKFDNGITLNRINRLQVNLKANK